MAKSPDNRKTCPIKSGGCGKQYKKRGWRRKLCPACHEAKQSQKQENTTCAEPDCTKSSVYNGSNHKYCPEHSIYRSDFVRFQYNWLRHRYRTTEAYPTADDAESIYLLHREQAKFRWKGVFDGKPLPLPINPYHLGHNIAYKDDGNAAITNMRLQDAVENMAGNQHSGFEPKPAPHYYANQTPLEPTWEKLDEMVEEFISRFGKQWLLDMAKYGHVSDGVTSLWLKWEEKTGIRLDKMFGTTAKVLPEMLDCLANMGIKMYQTKSDLPVFNQHLLANYRVYGLPPILSPSKYPTKMQYKHIQDTVPYPVQLVHAYHSQFGLQETDAGYYAYQTAMLRQSANDEYKKCQRKGKDEEFWYINEPENYTFLVGRKHHQNTQKTQYKK